MNGCMLTPNETNALRALLAREAATAPLAVATSAAQDTEYSDLAPGDVAQIRPGACRTWETSLLLVTQTDTHQVRGQILRPHRSGCREAWAHYSRAEVLRVGRVAYPEPARDILAWCYEPLCPLRLRKPPASEGAPAATTADATARYRDRQAALTAELATEHIRVAQAATKHRGGR